MNETTFRIGFSGHQQLGDETTLKFVSQQLRELLITYQQQACHDGKDIVVYSALALGADQLFVNIALELGIPVEAVIPCSCYEEIFTSPETRSEYHRLLDRCQKVHWLASQDCSDDAFLAAGHWIVDHSDLMILVWNGYPAAGRGGTADIASYARSVGRPFFHVHTRLHKVKQYGSLSDGSKITHVAAKRQFVVSKQTVYQGPILRVDQYQLRMPNGKEIVRDIVERPES